MKKKICIFVGIILIVLIVTGIIMNYYIKEFCDGIQKEDKQATISKEDLETINSIISNKINSERRSYSKKIEDTTIELKIPNEWNYEEIPQEENSDYRFALRIYKDLSEKSATLYFYNKIFGVCGTGLTTERIELDNGKLANVGYYDTNWSFISFYELNSNIAFINNGLKEDDAKEALNFIKTINIETTNTK